MGGPSFPGAFRPICSLVKPSAQGVAESWRKQYHREDGWLRTVTGCSGEIYNKIIDLGQSPDPSKVAEIIGNKSWTHPRCTITGNELDVAVSFAREYEEPIILSPDLVFEAARLLREGK